MCLGKIAANVLQMCLNLAPVFGRKAASTDNAGILPSVKTGKLVERL